jgi:hypothetical protein
MKSNNEISVQITNCPADIQNNDPLKEAAALITSRYSVQSFKYL